MPGRMHNIRWNRSLSSNDNEFTCQLQHPPSGDDHLKVMLSDAPGEENIRLLDGWFKLLFQQFLQRPAVPADDAASAVD